MCVCVCLLCHLDENRILDSLPIKMKGDLAIHVHLDTICKVALFQVNHHLNTPVIEACIALVHVGLREDVAEGTGVEIEACPVCARRLHLQKSNKTRGNIFGMNTEFLNHYVG